VDEENLRGVPASFQPDLIAAKEIPGLADLLDGPGENPTVFQHDVQTRARQADAGAVALRGPAVQVVAIKVHVHTASNHAARRLQGLPFRPLLRGS
jgi:hypothetical protein